MRDWNNMWTGWSKNVIYWPSSWRRGGDGAKKWLWLLMMMIWWLLKAAIIIAAVVVTIIINFMHHSPSEANRSKARQEIPQVLWNLKANYLVYNSPTLVPVLSCINLVHILPSYFFKIHYNITLPSMAKSPKWYFPSGFPIKTLQAFFFLSYICHTSHRSHPPEFEHPYNTWQWV